MPFDIDVAGAEAAIDEAGGFDALFQSQEGGEQPNAAVPAPGPTSAGSQGTTPTTDPATDPNVEAARQYLRDQQGRFASEEQTAQATQGADPSFMGENFDPNSLPPELQPAYKQMQGYFTRETQRVAPWRKLADESGIESPDDLRQVIELQQMLRDPESWVALHQELTQGLETMGLSPAAARAEATRQMSDGQAAPQVPTLDPASIDDPELAPFAQAYKSLQSDLSETKQMLEQMQSTWQAERQAAEQEALRLQFLGEMQRQENVIRTAHPEYTDADIEHLKSLSVVHEGNLFAAHAAFEAQQARWAEQYLGAKQAPKTAPIVATPPAPTPSTPAEGEYKTLDQAHNEAMDYLKAHGLLDEF